MRFIIKDYSPQTTEWVCIRYSRKNCLAKQNLCKNVIHWYTVWTGVCVYWNTGQPFWSVSPEAFRTRDELFPNKIISAHFKRNCVWQHLHPWFVAWWHHWGAPLFSSAPVSAAPPLVPVHAGYRLCALPQLLLYQSEHIYWSFFLHTIETTIKQYISTKPTWNSFNTSMMLRDCHLLAELVNVK